MNIGQGRLEGACSRCGYGADARTASGSACAVCGAPPGEGAPLQILTLHGSGRMPALIGIVAASLVGLLFIIMISFTAARQTTASREARTSTAVPIAAGSSAVAVGPAQATPASTPSAAGTTAPTAMPVTGQASAPSTATPIVVTSTVVATATAVLRAAPSTATSVPSRDTLMADLATAWARSDWPGAVQTAQRATELYPSDEEIREKLFAARVNAGDAAVARDDRAGAAAYYAAADGPRTNQQIQDKLRSLTPTPTPSAEQIAERAREQSRVAFRDYGQQLWDIGTRSDENNKALNDALRQLSIANSAQVYRLAQRVRENQFALSGQAVNVKVDDRGKRARAALGNLATQRKLLADKVMAALDSGKTSDLAAVQTQGEIADRATLAFGLEFVTIATELGVDTEEFKRASNR